MTVLARLRWVVAALAVALFAPLLSAVPAGAAPGDLVQSAAPNDPEYPFQHHLPVIGVP